MHPLWPLTCLVDDRALAAHRQPCLAVVDRLERRGLIAARFAGADGSDGTVSVTATAVTAATAPAIRAVRRKRLRTGASDCTGA